MNRTITKEVGNQIQLYLGNLGICVSLAMNPSGTLFVKCWLICSSIEVEITGLSFVCHSETFEVYDFDDFRAISLSYDLANPDFPNNLISEFANVIKTLVEHRILRKLYLSEVKNEI